MEETFTGFLRRLDQKIPTPWIEIDERPPERPRAAVRRKPPNRAKAPLVVPVLLNLPSRRAQNHRQKKNLTRQPDLSVVVFQLVKYPFSPQIRFPD